MPIDRRGERGASLGSSKVRPASVQAAETRKSRQTDAGLWRRAGFRPDLLDEHAHCGRDKETFNRDRSYSESGSHAPQRRRLQKSVHLRASLCRAQPAVGSGEGIVWGLTQYNRRTAAASTAFLV